MIRGIVPLAVLVCCVPAFAQDNVAVSDTGASVNQAQIDAINAKYQPEYDKIEQESGQLNGGSGCLFNMSGTAKWGETKTAFDIPQVTMKNREFSFDTIKTTFKNRGFSFDLPDCRWKVKKIWSGFKTKVYSCGMKRVDFSTKIPEFKKERTGFSTKIPEFKNKRIEWKYHILKIGKLEEFNAPCKKQQELGNNLSERGTVIHSAHMKELRPVLKQQLSDGVKSLSEGAYTVDAEMAKAIADMDIAIGEIKGQGGDPNATMTEIDGQQLSLPAARTRIEELRVAVLKEMAVQQANLEKELAGMNEVLA